MLSTLLIQLDQFRFTARGCLISRIAATTRARLFISLLSSPAQPLDQRLGTVLQNTSISISVSRDMDMRCFATLAGYVIGALQLVYWVDFDSPDHLGQDLSPSDPSWVGAWWFSFLLCG